MKPTIVGHKEGEGVPYSIERIGGPRDGTKFTWVKTKLSNGEEGGAFICSARLGYWKQVFVPYDLEHKDFI